MSEHPPTDREYQQKLEVKLLQVLHHGPATFHCLVMKAEGAYPTDVALAIQGLEMKGAIVKCAHELWRATGSESVLVATESVENQLEPDDSYFPEPHPLDFDWRFSGKTLDFLYQQLKGDSLSDVAILGAPTLFKFLRDRALNAHLFDRNDQITGYLTRAGYQSVTCCDLFRFVGKKQFASVVADPPWYLDYYRAFIEAARGLLVPNGKLFLSVLPRLTRPSAESDQSEILCFANERGFDLICAERSALRYLSPPFEKEALKSENLTISSWRSGDLYTFSLSDRTVPEHRIDQLEEDELWHTWSIGRTVVKVKWDGSHGHEAFEVRSVGRNSEMRYRSVSRRSPLRSEINIWTSRNIALRTSRPDVVSEALQLVSEGYGSKAASVALAQAEQLESAQARRLEEFLDALINESTI
ncbi:MAG: hypothetical protein JST79_17960 [Acidobacteria bacterium]|nr:hypothetical protein [Acidobacteriota bacterium]